MPDDPATSMAEHGRFNKRIKPVKPLFFVLPHSKVTAALCSDVYNFLQILPGSSSAQEQWQQSWTAAAQNWRGLTITKLTQSTGTLSGLKNLLEQKLQLRTAAADLQIKLFFNCRPH
jgi:hypothetical protein